MAYAGDDAPGTLHLGLRDPSVEASHPGPVGIVSLYQEPIAPKAGLNHQPGDWRLRGMAVAPAHQGKGYGKRLVAAGLDAVRAAGATRVWCNARKTAVGFYQRQGFAAAGDPFDLPGIGEHFVMWIAVEPDHG